ncbi:hypothetical protein MCUN1_000821 [Malassezia cuniculi]|uniref:Uncharacterized protein n=1 Tax=Malassezia cuniculi TaxID=948313 RepID=A0AAF0ENQ1_9BASI|nr:hypothetical protein MCUN1_000821 [Malassezia cuniculi]
MGDSLRNLLGRYGSQAEHQRIASPAAAADARRRRMAARVGAIRSEEDYIPLDGPKSRSVLRADDNAYQGPHPESSLVREEDEIGDAEDELAEYTGATERIPLGRDAERRQKEARRAQIRHLLAQAQGEDEDEEDIPIIVRNVPHSAASVPSVPVIIDIDEMRDGTRVYDEDPFGGVPDEPMDDEPIRAAAEEGDDWEKVQLGRIGVREEEPVQEPVQAAIIPLTTGLPTPTSCMARLSQMLTALDESCAKHQQRIADAHATIERYSDDSEDRKAVAVLEDRAAWFSDLESFVDDLALFIDAKMPQLEALEEEMAQFAEHAAELQGRADRLFADTQLAEFRDPAATDEDGRIIAYSLVSRFTEWRTRYPDDYNRAWGGLALGSAWEFWARAEQALWDPFWPHGDESRLPSQCSHIDDFKWQRDVMDFVDQGGHPPRGGDDELVATMVSSVVVARLVSLAENGAYDPWSKGETACAVALVDHVAQVIEGIRLKTIARAFLSCFREHVHVLQSVFAAPVTHSPPPIHPDTPRARMYIAEQLAMLASNLFSWHYFWSTSFAPWSDVELSEFATVANDLVSMLCDALQDAHEFGSVVLAQALAKQVSPHVSVQLKRRLEQLQVHDV